MLFQGVTILLMMTLLDEMTLRSANEREVNSGSLTV